MRRADRLFRIVQSLRRRRVTTARRLAEELEVSERTVYRDVRDLILSGVPIEGEAGVGYALGRGFDLPPLMFTEDEVEALVLGARVAASWGDAALARAAEHAVAKIEAVVPERMRHKVARAPVLAPSFHVPPNAKTFVAPLRGAIHDRKRVWMAYVDKDGADTERTVRPLGLVFWGTWWSLAGWCELRNGFRNFRLDRIREVRVTGETFAPESGRALDDFLRAMESEVPPHGAGGARGRDRAR